MIAVCRIRRFILVLPHIFAQYTQCTLINHIIPLRSLSAWSLPYYRNAASIFGPSGLNSAFGLDFGLRPQFSAVRVSFRSAASTHSAACSVLHCSVTASYKDVDVSPWWRCLYDVTANGSPNCYIPLLKI